jgi:hypothetical protein
MRFDPYNIFPKNYSNTKHCPSVEFYKFVPRDDKMYKNNMSDPIFDRDKHLNVYKPKPKGILQFSKMN